MVDAGVKKITNLVNDFYKDDLTSFVFTADHGMTDWGISDFFTVVFLYVNILSAILYSHTLFDLMINCWPLSIYLSSVTVFF